MMNNNHILYDMVIAVFCPVCEAFEKWLPGINRFNVAQKYNDINGSYLSRRSKMRLLFSKGRDQPKKFVMGVWMFAGILQLL